MTKRLDRFRPNCAPYWSIYSDRSGNGHMLTNIGPVRHQRDHLKPSGERHSWYVDDNARKNGTDCNRLWRICRVGAYTVSFDYQNILKGSHGILSRLVD